MQPAPDLLLGAAAKQHAVRHDRRDHPAWPQDREHVLREHQVRLLARLRREA